jgi:hypothetical protein
MASSRWWLPSGRRRTTQCTSPPSVGSVLREATPHVLASGRSCTWAAQVPNSPADLCLNNPEPPEIFPSRKSATHQKLRQGIMSLGLTTHDKKRIFKGEPAIARAGGAGCIRRLASSLLAGNPEVGAARHWRHARHGEGSRQQSDIRRGRRSLRARLPTRAAHCAGLAPRVQARPGHMIGATRRVTPPRQGGHHGGRWGHPNAQFTRGHEAYTPDTSSLHPDPPFPSPAPAQRTWTTPCWLLGLHSGGAAGVREWHTSS